MFRGKVLLVVLFLMGFSMLSLSAATNVKRIQIKRALTKEAKACIDCHAEKHSGIVQDWRNSRHGHVGVSCIDCHRQEKDSKMATQNCPGVKGTDIYMSAMVTPATCAKCHPEEYKQFSQSGHVRARSNWEGKSGLWDMMEKYEGQAASEHMLKTASKNTGCMQCHGSIIKLDKDGRGTPDTWPNSGIGTIWPDGSVGNCTVCHTRHSFDITEARKPDACSSCHLGPDHPQIEIFENSKHGHIYKTKGDSYKWDSPPDAWEPGDYKAPTCAVCHMAGIGDLKTTHNITRRLHWNLWAKKSKVRNNPDPLNMWAGDGIKGRAEMKKVCSNCHTSTFANNFFQQFDGQVELYNKKYYEPTLKMLNELKDKKLVGDNPWSDEFLKGYFFLWHHEGRRMRMGAAMAGPDYAHWHGSFEVMLRFYELQKIYKKRIKTNKLDDH